MKSKFSVYWNIRKNIFSVRGQDGIVKRYEEHIRMKDVEFRVSDSGRRRVLKTGQKNVHAVVKGEILKGGIGASMRGWKRVTYNPFKYESFVTSSDGMPIYGAQDVMMAIRSGKPALYAKGVIRHK